MPATRSRSAPAIPSGSVVAVATERDGQMRRVLRPRPPDAIPPEHGGLRVIGAGFGRTGTTSLLKALGILGLGPCYHMRVAMTRPGHGKFWIRAKAGEPVDYRRFFRGYRSAVDWPTCEFYRELMALYPDAKVLLTVRDPDAWYDSMRETLWVVRGALPWWYSRSIVRMHEAVFWQSRFNGEFTNRERTIEVYLSHIAEVRRTVPPGRLLEFRIEEGWAPLCRFLDVPVPEGVSFPCANDRALFRKLLLALRIVEWAVPVLVVLGAVCLARILN